MTDVFSSRSFSRRAGLIFLSPCVLPACSGLHLHAFRASAWEQLRIGAEVPELQLVWGPRFPSSPAFPVVSFFGGIRQLPSAFSLKQNRNAPDAHRRCTHPSFRSASFSACSIKLNPRGRQLFFGGPFLGPPLGIASFASPCSAVRRAFGCAATSFSLSICHRRLFGSRLCPGWLNRGRPPPQFCRTAHGVERLLLSCLWLSPFPPFRLDSLHLWPHPHDRTHHRRPAKRTKSSAAYLPPSRSTPSPGPGHLPFSFLTASGHRQIHDVL